MILHQRALPTHFIYMLVLEEVIGSDVGGGGLAHPVNF